VGVIKLVPDLVVVGAGGIFLVESHDIDHCLRVLLLLLLRDAARLQHPLPVLG
jgi:hypothetical protein